MSYILYVYTDSPPHEVLVLSEEDYNNLPDDGAGFGLGHGWGWGEGRGEGWGEGRGEGSGAGLGVGGGLGWCGGDAGGKDIE